MVNVDRRDSCTSTKARLVGRVPHGERKVLLTASQERTLQIERMLVHMLLSIEWRESIFLSRTSQPTLSLTWSSIIVYFFETGHILLWQEIQIENLYCYLVTKAWRIQKLMENNTAMNLCLLSANSSSTELINIWDCTGFQKIHMEVYLIS